MMLRSFGYIFLAAAALMPAALASASGEARLLETGEVESRFFVTVNMDLNGGATAPFPDPIQFACGPEALPVLLEDANFDWISAEHCRLDEDSTILECFSLPTKTRMIAGSVGMSTSIVVACRGNSTVASDYNYLEVTLPESTYSVLDVSPFLPSFGMVTRSAIIHRICDFATLDGTLMVDHYFPQSRMDFDTSCNGISNGFTWSCDGVQSCDEDNNYQFGTPCEDYPLPEMVATVNSDDGADEVGTSCLFSAAPNRPVPDIDDGVTVYRADYAVAYAYEGSDYCDFDSGVITITCENGGIMDDFEESPVCQRNGTSTQICDANVFTAGEGVVSCSGSSLEELSISVVWTPGSDDLSCNDPIFGVYSRSLVIGQQCPLDVMVLRPRNILLSADDMAVSCYPYAASATDIIVEEIKDTVTGQVVDSNLYPYEICAMADAGCTPDCADQVPVTAIKAAILPQHIDLECVYSSATTKGGLGVGKTANGAFTTKLAGEEEEGNADTKNVIETEVSGGGSLHGCSSSTGGRSMLGCGSFGADLKVPEPTVPVPSVHVPAGASSALVRKGGKAMVVCVMFLLMI